MCFRRRLYQEIGGFDEWIGTQFLAAGEDYEFSLRATRHGYNLYRDPGIAVLHKNQLPGGLERLSAVHEDVHDAQIRMSSYALIKNRRPGLTGWAHVAWRSYHGWVLNRHVLGSGPVRLWKRQKQFARMFRMALDDVRRNATASERGIACQEPEC